MADVVFLGTNGSLQERGSGNTSLLLLSSDIRILVDVSSNVQEAVENDIDVVIVTHSHTDHVYGIPSLLHQLWLSGRKRLLTIYAPKAVIPLIDSLINAFSLRKKKNFFPLEIKEVENFQVGNTEISFFKTDHTDASIGLLFKDDKGKILYTSDTRPIKEIKEDWIDSDILIHESSGLSSDEDTLIKKGHSSGRDASTLASRIRCRRLILCHLPLRGKEEILNEARIMFDNTILPSPLTVYSTEEK